MDTARGTSRADSWLVDDVDVDDDDDDADGGGGGGRGSHVPSSCRVPTTNMFGWACKMHEEVEVEVEVEMEVVEGRENGLRVIS
jgi:hypothetical protein